ncbi:hypothetical protein F441_05876 [Phytophthora nicotianae CJ01A1]|nr:hypothetical protein L915_05743 [Phytophthora nicotianae]ETL43916.1 hypothetical protein L916_05679 [Phytophthora nicotianae]ETL97078.1 hypothetical protein L917_05567 [Phytophthora nicotianae]ETP20401.1 hypothetical protein F441_05876 [Phytophthora nicotianae CJ01A1]
MNKNVLSKAREVLGKLTVENPAPGQSKYSNSLATDKFMALFYRTVGSETEEDLRANKTALAECNAQLAAYLSEHWLKYEDKNRKGPNKSVHALRCSRYVNCRGDSCSMQALDQVDPRRPFYCLQQVTSMVDIVC